MFLILCKDNARQDKRKAKPSKTSCFQSFIYNKPVGGIKLIDISKSCHNADFQSKPRIFQKLSDHLVFRCNTLTSR